MNSSDTVSAFKTSLPLKVPSFNNIIAQFAISATLELIEPAGPTFSISRQGISFITPSNSWCGVATFFNPLRSDRTVDERFIFKGLNKFV